MVRLRSSITLLLAILVMTSALVTVLGPGAAVSNALKIEGASYDVWLTPCACYGGTLRIAWPSEPPTLNWWVAGSTWDLTALDVMYDRPVRVINGTLTFEAVEWMEYSPDYKVLTMGVRKGMKFHDGVEVTAEDLAFTINVLAQKAWTYYHGYFTSVDKAEAADKYTVKVYFKSPDAQFILNSLNALRIMPKHIWEPLLNSLGDELAKYSPKPADLIGSGPFKFVDRVPGQYLKFAANKDYWLGRPCIDELILIPMTDVSVIILGLQKGELDAYAWGVEAPVVPKLLATPNVAIHVYASEYFYHWGLNNEVWPLNISKFRLALSYAINKQGIINDVLLGYGMPGSPGVVGPIGSATPWYNPNVEKLVYFNRSKAAEILDEIGFKDINNDGWREGPKGETVVVEIYSPTPGYDPIRARIAELLRGELSKIPGGGIKAEVYYYEWATLWPLIQQGKVMSWLLGSGWAPDIGWLYNRFHSRPGGSGNWARYANPEVDKLTEELLTTFDPAKRKEIAWKIQEYLALDAPVINLYYRFYPNPYRTDKFTNWFTGDTADSVFNRVTLLRVQLKPGVCPTPVTTPKPTTPTTPATTPTTPATTPTTPKPTTPTATTPTTTPTTPKPTTTPTPATTTPPPAGPDYTWITVGAITIIIVIVVAFLLIRRR